MTSLSLLAGRTVGTNVHSLVEKNNNTNYEKKAKIRYLFIAVGWLTLISSSHVPPCVVKFYFYFFFHFPHAIFKAIFSPAIDMHLGKFVIHTYVHFKSSIPYPANYLS